MLKKNIPVDDLACSKNNLQNVIEEPGETPDADKATKDLVLQPSNDISLCIGKTYTQAERLRMLKNIWIPDQSFNFPITATNHQNLFTVSAPLVYSLQVVSVLIFRKWSLLQILRFIWK